MANKFDIMWFAYTISVLMFCISWLFCIWVKAHWLLRQLQLPGYKHKTPCLSLMTANVSQLFSHLDNLPLPNPILCTLFTHISKLHRLLSVYPVGLHDLEVHGAQIHFNHIWTCLWRSKLQVKQVLNIIRPWGDRIFCCWQSILYWLNKCGLSI